MFSVRFRRRVRARVRRRRRNDCCFSRQNRLNFTLDIWDKESIGLGKCTGWPFCDPYGCDIDKQKFACLQDKVRTTRPIITKLGSYMLINWSDFGGILWENLFCQIFFENFGCVFSRSNTLLDISQEWLVRLMWNEKEVHRMDTGWTMWPWPLTWPMTLTL